MSQWHFNSILLDTINLRKDKCLVTFSSNTKDKNDRIQIFIWFYFYFVYEVYAKFGVL